MKFKLPILEGDDEVPMAPMIDMVFLLLIFFMVASHLNQLDKVEIEVPQAQNAKVPKEMLDRRTITVKHDESIYLGTKPAELDQVTPLVKKERLKVPGLKIFLRADKRVKYRRVREVMKACADAGAAEIIFATYETDSPMKEAIQDMVNEPVGLQIAPLIDVVFLLLIYFMVTSSLKRQEADLGIQLPGSVAQSKAVAIPDEQIIEVTASGDILLNGQVFAADSGHDIPELYAILTRYRLASDATRTKALVTIQAEDEAVHARVIDAMNACAGAGIKHVTFGMGE